MCNIHISCFQYTQLCNLSVFKIKSFWYNFVCFINCNFSCNVVILPQVWNKIWSEYIYIIGKIQEIILMYYYYQLISIDLCFNLIRKGAFTIWGNICFLKLQKKPLYQKVGTSLNAKATKKWHDWQVVETPEITNREGLVAFAWYFLT